MGDDPLAVLVVEDNDYDARRIAKRVEASGTATFEVERVGRLDDALDAVDADAHDVVLLDLGLPDSAGLDTLTRFREAAPGMPVVVLTGLRDEEAALKAVREGAHDYLLKDHADTFRLVHVLRHAVQRSRRAAQAEAALAKLIDDPGVPGTDALVRGLTNEARASSTYVINSLVQARQELQAGQGGHVPSDQAARAADAVETAVDAVERIDHLIGVLTSVVGADVPDRPTSLHEPVVTAVYLFQAIERRGVGVDADLTPTGPLAAPPRRVQQLVLDLMEAVAGVAPDDGLLLVRTVKDDGGAVVRVGLEGPADGVPDLGSIEEQARSLGARVDVSEDGVGATVAFPVR